MGDKLGVICYISPMRTHEKYLHKRGQTYYYERRVPKEYAEFDRRKYVKKSLKTRSLEVAIARRNSLVEADDLFWASISSAADGISTTTHQAERTKAAIRRYEGAKRRAMSKGFIYTPNDELLSQPDIANLIKRLDTLPGHMVPKRDDAEAVLGIIAKPSITITQALDLYCDKIEMASLIGKSESQKASWKKIKRRSVANFVDMHGDMPMDKITRDEARKFYNWWGERLLPKGNQKGRSANTANRDLGNLRKLYRKYWEYEGEEERLNPFRNLNFVESKGQDVPHFDNDWVTGKILEPEIFTSLNRQAILIAYALIETGCRPSEISNILPENIIIDHEVPHIRIRKQGNRQLKTSSSIRDIPLVGVSLIAMKNAQKGFPKYHDKGNLLSVSLLKAFRRRSLFPTETHRIYSFRHSFEKRMLEAGLDYDLRCLLMGHKNTRPQYGDGGSLEYRRSELMKIVHPVPNDFEKRLIAVCDDESKSNQYTKRMVYVEETA